MEVISEAQNKSSFYCWLILIAFIGGTLVFMVNFYNRALDDIAKNSMIYNTELGRQLHNNGNLE